MPDEQGTDSLSRRHFMVTAIGASAALAANTKSGSAQAATASPGTVFTGDIIDGKKVISALNIDDLKSGKKHFLYDSEMAAGESKHSTHQTATRS